MNFKTTWFGKDGFMAKRNNVLKSDASLKTAASVIEKLFGLPEGSVKLVKRDGRKMREDAMVGTLRNHWKEDE